VLKKTLSYRKIVVYIVVIQITKVVDMKNQLINFKGSIINQVLISKFILVVDIVLSQTFHPSFRCVSLELHTANFGFKR
jgi:hypothetical protein